MDDDLRQQAQQAHLTVAGCMEILRTDALTRGDTGTAILASALASVLEEFDFGTMEHARVHRAVVHAIEEGSGSEGTFTGWVGAHWLTSEL